jgi:putative salt-induced outer membrane protein
MVIVFGMSVLVFRNMLPLALLLAAVPLRAESIPPAVEAMLEAVADNPDQLKVIADVAKRTNPEAAGEIDAKVASYAKAREEAKMAKLAEQSFFQGWSGQGELGGFTSSGNTNVTGLSVGVTLGKTTRKATHNLRGQFDWQRNQNIVVRERILASYEGNFNINERLYTLGTLGYERDRFSGFTSRYAGSLGLGWRLATGQKFRMALEAGPAIRQTAFTNGNEETSIAARGGLIARWAITPALVLTENSSIYVDSFNTSFASLTALTARINGALSARASLQINTESNPPAGRRNSDTTSRATIVYNF